MFNLYEERKADEMHYEERKADEMHSMTTRCIIWSWYLGAIVGSICAGFALQKIRKGRIYVSVSLNLTFCTMRACESRIVSSSPVYSQINVALIHFVFVSQTI